MTLTTTRTRCYSLIQQTNPLISRSIRPTRHSAGDGARHSDVVMENLIGAEADDWARLARDPDAALHLYGKAEARPGRKMGHVNRVVRR